ncbi:hypothetical protein FRX31_002253 [Thalictrum thalictroides]|uniref:Uncharacterized protein n=1 Tax=Thalictrum thalictroides TaxID=46969 RepID=A0A7J6XED0_THATH|nr:hypothetical protein FRX31_002253 [Thalictrum thalictroides]
MMRGGDRSEWRCEDMVVHATAVAMENRLGEVLQIRFYGSTNWKGYKLLCFPSGGRREGWTNMGCALLNLVNYMTSKEEDYKEDMRMKQGGGRETEVYETRGKRGVLRSNGVQSFQQMKMAHRNQSEKKKRSSNWKSFQSKHNL